MPTINTTSNISYRTAGHASANLLKRAQAFVTLERFMQFDPLGKNKTMTRTYRRYLSLPPATAPLDEVTGPEGSAINYEELTVNLQEYGDFTKITRRIMDTHEDDVLGQAQQLNAEQVVETVEIIRAAVLRAGTNVFYANAAADRASVNSPATSGDLRKIVRQFKRNRVKTISEIIAPTAKVSTVPVAPAYFAIGHTDLGPDLRGITGYTPVENYANPADALPGEHGKFESIRFILTETIFEPWQAAGTAGTTYLAYGSTPSGSTQADVYPLIVVGQNAFFGVPLQGKNAVRTVVKNPEPQVGDELGRTGWVGWNAYQGALIINELNVARLEVACTANPS